MTTCLEKAWSEFNKINKETDSIVKSVKCMDKAVKNNKIVKLDKRMEKISKKRLQKWDKVSELLSEAKTKKEKNLLSKEYKESEAKNYTPQARDISAKRKEILYKLCKKPLSKISKDTKQELKKSLSKRLKCKEMYKGHNKQQTKTMIKEINNNKFIGIIY
jgi:NhaP-type Na+/H+ and K+/H+ antiporter